MQKLGRGWKWALAAVVLAAIVSAEATAATTFGFLAGSVRVTAHRDGDPGNLLVDTVLDLDGVFVEFSDSPVGLTDFRITIPQSSFSLSSSYGGYDQIMIESVLLTPGTGYTTSGSGAGPVYTVNGSPVAVEAVYGAMDSSGTNADLSNIGLSFDTAFANATVRTDLQTLIMNDIVLGQLPGALMTVPETSDLIIKGDITFIGAVPEPGSGTLFLIGLTGLAVARRRNGI